MDHVVYVDSKAGALMNMLSGEKTMLIRGAAGRKMPYGRVNGGDTLYLVENDGSSLVKARCRVVSVTNSEKMTPVESTACVEGYQEALQLTSVQFKRWAGKRYLVFIAVEGVEEVSPFTIDKREYGNMDDWLPVGEIEKVRLDPR